MRRRGTRVPAQFSKRRTTAIEGLRRPRWVVGWPNDRTFSAPKKRSKIMAAVKGKNTKPELTVRSLLHSMGYRYRVHVRGLPGKPDIYFSKRKKAVQISGCFWHGHEGCSRAKLPKTNRTFWRNKIGRNVERDKKNLEKLSKLGIETLVVWECEIRNGSDVKKRLKKFLGRPKVV